MTPVQSVYEMIQQSKLPDAELRRGPQPYHRRVEPRQSELLTIAFRAGFNFGFNHAQKCLFLTTQPSNAA